eukprot:gene32438-40036_t
MDREESVDTGQGPAELQIEGGLKSMHPINIPINRGAFDSSDRSIQQPERASETPKTKQCTSPPSSPSKRIKQPIEKRHKYRTVIGMDFSCLWSTDGYAEVTEKQYQLVLKELLAEVRASKKCIGGFTVATLCKKLACFGSNKERIVKDCLVVLRRERILYLDVNTYMCLPPLYELPDAADLEKVDVFEDALRVKPNPLVP